MSKLIQKALESNNPDFLSRVSAYANNHKMTWEEARIAATQDFLEFGETGKWNDGSMTPERRQGISGYIKKNGLSIEDQNQAQDMRDKNEGRGFSPYEITYDNKGRFGVISRRLPDDKKGPSITEEGFKNDIEVKAYNRALNEALNENIPLKRKLEKSMDWAELFDPKTKEMKPQGKMMISYEGMKGILGFNDAQKLSREVRLKMPKYTASEEFRQMQEGNKEGAATNTMNFLLDSAAKLGNTLSLYALWGKSPLQFTSDETRYSSADMERIKGVVGHSQNDDEVFTRQKKTLTETEEYAPSWGSLGQREVGLKEDVLGAYKERHEGLQNFAYDVAKETMNLFSIGRVMALATKGVSKIPLGKKMLDALSSEETIGETYSAAREMGLGRLASAGKAAVPWAKSVLKEGIMSELVFGPAGALSYARMSEEEKKTTSLVQEAFLNPAVGMGMGGAVLGHPLTGHSAKNILFDKLVTGPVMTMLGMETMNVLNDWTKGPQRLEGENGEVYNEYASIPYKILNSDEYFKKSGKSFEEYWEPQIKMYMAGVLTGAFHAGADVFKTQGAEKKFSEKTGSFLRDYFEKNHYRLREKMENSMTLTPEEVERLRDVSNNSFALAMQLRLGQGEGKIKVGNSELEITPEERQEARRQVETLLEQEKKTTEANEFDRQILTGRTLMFNKMQLEPEVRSKMAGDLNYSVIHDMTERVISERKKSSPELAGMIERAIEESPVLSKLDQVKQDMVRSRAVALAPYPDGFGRIERVEKDGVFSQKEANAINDLVLEVSSKMPEVTWSKEEFSLKLEHGKVTDSIMEADEAMENLEREILNLKEETSHLTRVETTTTAEEVAKEGRLRINGEKLEALEGQMKMRQEELETLRQKESELSRKREGLKLQGDLQVYEDFSRMYESYYKKPTPRALSTEEKKAMGNMLEVKPQEVDMLKKIVKDFEKTDPALSFKASRMLEGHYDRKVQNFYREVSDRIGRERYRTDPTSAQGDKDEILYRMMAEYIPATQLDQIGYMTPEEHLELKTKVESLLEKERVSSKAGASKERESFLESLLPGNKGNKDYLNLLVEEYRRVQDVENSSRKAPQAKGQAQAEAKKKVQSVPEVPEVRKTAQEAGEESHPLDTAGPDGRLVRGGIIGEAETALLNYVNDDNPELTFKEMLQTADAMAGQSRKSKGGKAGPLTLGEFASHLVLGKPFWDKTKVEEIKESLKVTEETPLEEVLLKERERLLGKFSEVKPVEAVKVERVEDPRLKSLTEEDYISFKGESLTEKGREVARQAGKEEALKEIKAAALASFDYLEGNLGAREYLKKIGEEREVGSLEEGELKTLADEKASYFEGLKDGGVKSSGARVLDGTNEVLLRAGKRDRIKGFVEAVSENVRENFTPEGLRKIEEEYRKLKRGELDDHDMKSLDLLMKQLYAKSAPMEYSTAIENMYLDLLRHSGIAEVGDRRFPIPMYPEVPEGADKDLFTRARKVIEEFIYEKGEEGLKAWSDKVSKSKGGWETNKVVDKTVKEALKEAGPTDYYDLMQGVGETSRNIKQALYNYAMDHYNAFATPDKFRGSFTGDRNFYGGRIYKVLTPREYAGVGSKAVHGIIAALGLRMSPDSFTESKIDSVMDVRLKDLSKEDFIKLLKTANVIEAKDFSKIGYGEDLSQHKKWFMDKVMREATSRFNEIKERVMSDPLMTELFQKAVDSGKFTGDVTLEKVAEDMGLWDAKDRKIKLSGLNPSLYGTTTMNGKTYDNLELVLTHELVHPLARYLITSSPEFKAEMEKMGQRVLTAIEDYTGKDPRGKYFGDTFTKKDLEAARSLIVDKDGKLDIEEFMAYATGGKTALQGFMNNMPSDVKEGEGFWHELIGKIVSYLRKDSELKKFADLVEAATSGAVEAESLSEEVSREVRSLRPETPKPEGEYMSDEDVMKLIEETNKGSKLEDKDVKIMSSEAFNPEKTPENTVESRLLEDVDEEMKKRGLTEDFEGALDEIWKDAAEVRKIIPALARIVGAEGDDVYTNIHTLNFETFRGMFEVGARDTERIRRDKKMIREMFFEASDRRHAPTGTTKEELFEAKIRRLYLNTKSLTRVKFIDALMDKGGRISLKALPENFKDAEGNKKNSYRSRIKLMDKTEDLKEIFGENFEVQFINSFNGETFHSAANRGKFSVENVTEAAMEGGFIYLNQFADKSTYPVLKLTGEGKSPKDIYPKVQTLYKSYRSMFTSAGEDPGLFMTDSELEDPRNMARATTITIRTVLEDLKLGLKASDIGVKSRLFNMDSEGNVRPENMITLMKRYQLASELTHTEFDSYTLSRLKEKQFMGRPLIGSKETDPVFMREGKVFVNAIVLSTKDMLNKTGQSRLDGASIYLKGQFDEVYKTLEGTVNAGVIKNFVIHNGMYLKHAMHAWSAEDALGSLMARHGVAVVIADESEKNKPHRTFQMGPEGKMEATGEAPEYEVTSYGEFERGNLKKIQIPLDAFNRIKEDASYNEKVMGWSQIANASGFSNMNPVMSEIMVELMGRFARGNAMVMNDLVGSDEKVMDSFRRRVLRAIEEPFTPQEKVFSRMFRKFKGSDAESSDLFNEFSGFLTHSVVRDVLKDFLKMPLYEQVKQQRKGSKITLGMDGGNYSSSRLRYADFHMGRLPFRSAEELESLGVEASLAKKMEAVARVWMNHDKAYREAEYYLEREEFKTKKSKRNYEHEARVSRKIAIEAKKSLNALISRHRESLGLEALDYNNKDYDITVKNLGDKGVSHLEKLKSEAFDEEGFLRHGYSMITEDAAYRLGLRAGDEIVTTITPSDSAMALHTSKVALILPRHQVNENLIVLNSEYIQGVGKDYDVDSVNIFTHDKAVMEREEVRDVLREKPYSEMTEAERFKEKKPEAWKVFMDEAKGLDRRYVREVFDLMTDLGVFSPEDLEGHEKTLEAIKSSGIETSRQSELMDYAKMKLAFSSGMQKKFMQMHLGESTDVKPRYNPLENDSLNLGNKFFKNVGEAVVLRELHDILSSMKFKSKVKVAGTEYKVDITRDKKEWMKNHLALLILTNDQVDYPKNNNKDYYRSESMNVFAHMLGLPYPEIPMREKALKMKASEINEIKKQREAVEDIHAGLMSLFGELSGVPRFRPDRVERDRMAATISRIVAGKSVLESLEGSKKGLPDVIGTSRVAQGKAEGFFRSAEFSKEGLLKYPLFSMVKSMDVSRIEREMARFNEFYTGNYDDSRHMQQMEFEVSMRLARDYYPGAGEIGEVFRRAMKGEKIERGYPVEMIRFAKEVQAQKAKMTAKMEEYYRRQGFEKTKARVTKVIESLKDLEVRYNRSLQQKSDKIARRMRQSVTRDFDRLTQAFQSGDFKGEAIKTKDFTTSLEGEEVSLKVIKDAVGRFEENLRKATEARKDPNYRIPESELEGLVKDTDLFMNSLYEWYVKEMTHYDPETVRKGHVMNNRDLGNLRQAIATIIKGRTRESEGVMSFENQSATDYFRHKKDVAGDMVLNALDQQSLDLGRGMAPKGVPYYDIKTKFKGHDFTLHMTSIMDGNFTRVKTEIVRDGVSMGTVTGRPEASRSEAEEAMVKVLKNPETWKSQVNRLALSDEFLGLYKAQNFPFEDRQAMASEYIARLLKEGRVNERDLEDVFISYMGIRRLNFAGLNLQVGSQKNNNILYSLMGTFTPGLLEKYMNYYAEINPEQVRLKMRQERERFGSTLLDLGQFRFDTARMRQQGEEAVPEEFPGKDEVDFLEAQDEMDQKKMADVFSTLEPRSTHTDEEVDLKYMERWHQYARDNMPLMEISKLKARDFVKRAKEDPAKAELELRTLARDMTILNAVRGLKPLEEVRRILLSKDEGVIKSYLKHLDDTLERNVISDLDGIRKEKASFRPYSLGQLYLELVSARDTHEAVRDNWFTRFMNEATNGAYGRFRTRGENILSFAHKNGLKIYGKNSALGALTPDFSPRFRRLQGRTQVSYDMDLEPWEVIQFMSPRGVDLKTHDRFFSLTDVALMQQIKLDQRLNLVMHEATSRFADAESQFKAVFERHERTVENRMKFNEAVNRHLEAFKSMPELSVIKDQFSNNLKVLMPDATGEAKEYGSPEAMAQYYLLRIKGMNENDPSLLSETYALASAFHYRYVYNKVVPDMIGGVIEFIKRSMETAEDPYTRQNYRDRLRRWQALSIFMSKGELRPTSEEEDMDAMERPQGNPMEEEGVPSRSFIPKLWTRESFIDNYVSYYRLDLERKVRSELRSALAKERTGGELTEEEKDILDLNEDKKISAYVLDRLTKEAEKKAGASAFVNPIFRNIYDTRVPGHMTNTTTAHMHFMAELREHIFNDVTYINYLNYDTKAFRMGESQFVRDTMRGWFKNMSSYRQLHSGKVEKEKVKPGMYVSFFVNERRDGVSEVSLKSGKVTSISPESITITNSLDEKMSWPLDRTYTPLEDGSMDLKNLSVFRREGVIERYEDARKVTRKKGEPYTSFGFDMNASDYHLGQLARGYEMLNKSYVMGTLGWAAGLSAMTRNIAGGITSIIEEAPLNLFRLPLPGSKNDTAGIKSDVQKAKITHKYEGLQEVIKGVSSINTNMMLDVLSEGMNLETDTSTLHLFPGMMKNNKFLLELYKSAINYDAYKKGLEEYEYALTRARINHDGASALTINAALNEYKENYMQEVRRAMTDADRISPKDPRFKEVKRLLKSQMAGEFRLSREAASRLLKDGIRQSVTQGMMSLMNRPEAWMRTTTAILAYRQAEEMGFSEKERNMIAMKSVMRQHQFYSSIYRTFGQGTRMGRVLKSLNHYVAGKLEAMRENVRETRDQYLLFGLKGLDPFRSELKVEGERFQENHAHKLANLIATSVVMDNIGQYLWGLQYVVNPVSSVFLGGLRLMLKAFDEDRKNKSDKNPVTWQQVYFAASAAMQLKMGTGSSFLVSVPYMALTGTPSDAVGVTNPKTGKIVGTVAHELTNYNSDYLQGWNNLIKAATGFGINRQGPGKMFGHYYSPLGLILPGGNDLLNFFIDEEEEKKEHKEMMKKTLPRRREEKKEKEERLKASNVRTSPIGEYIFGK